MESKTRATEVLDNNNISKKHEISLAINGEKMRLEVPETYRLVDILRHQLKLTGTKLSCEVGRCGACSVLMNGSLVNSCLIMAYQANDTEIVTIEGLSKEKLHPLQKAFLQEGGLQCGYCTSGMIIAVKALLAENPNPTEEELLEGLSGNLCRCTGYSGILRAVEKYKEDIL